MVNPRSPPGKTGREVVELSEVPNAMGVLHGRKAAEKFRNANGVYMKTMNFRRFDPDFAADGRTGLTRGNARRPLCGRSWLVSGLMLAICGPRRSSAESK